MSQDNIGSLLAGNSFAGNRGALDINQSLDGSLGKSALASQLGRSNYNPVMHLDDVMRVRKREAYRDSISKGLLPQQPCAPKTYRDELQQEINEWLVDV